ncbi:hypothetical protein OS493_027772 [Desmophyllum pertusum]|uniref:Amino acid transporter transmembrane domain-containing protein n=1 Tax=Desmophyllum pertusum TaxID=174260 RepID=A0A9X0CRQ6_9CNID|nr:hypothetical protein OS493_027772 [Desmophyllum pertusum]
MNSSTMIPPLEGKTTAPMFVLLVLIPLPFLVVMAYVRSIRQLGPLSGIANVTLLAGFFGLLAFLLQGLHFKLNDVSFARLSTFPIFFGQLTGAYEGIGTVIPIESSMAENRPRFPLYLHLAIAQVSFILGSFGILGYMIYGSNVPQILTDTLETVHSRSKSHMSEIIAGPSVDAGSNPTSPTDSATNESQYPQLDSSGSVSTSINETQVLIPKDTEELQYKTAAWKRNLLRTVLVLITAGIAVLLKE